MNICVDAVKNNDFINSVLNIDNSVNICDIAAKNNNFIESELKKMKALSGEVKSEKLYKKYIKCIENALMDNLEILQISALAVSIMSLILSIVLYL